MTSSTKYPPEVRERAVRMVFEHEPETRSTEDSEQNALPSRESWWVSLRCLR
jgi:hypothetical protein